MVRSDREIYSKWSNVLVWFSVAVIESRTTRLFPRTRSAIVHFLAPTYARPVGCRRRNEIGEEKFQGCHALGKVRRGVRGCLTKGMDKFYAETVKRVSSGQREGKSRWMPTGARGVACIWRGGTIPRRVARLDRVKIFPS